MADEPKKRVAFSSTAATLKWARATWGDEAVGISSWWQSAGGIGGVRKDLLGFADAVVLDGLPGVLALQACGSDVGAHVKKLDGELAGRARIKPERLLKMEIDAAKLAGRVKRWLAAGNRLLIVAWRDVWVGTSERHKVRKKMPRFLEARLAERPDPPFTTRHGILWVGHDNEGRGDDLMAKKAQGAVNPEGGPRSHLPAKKTREGICLALPATQAELLRDLARRMGLSQKSLREHLEASPVFAEAVNEALKRKWNSWNEARAKEDPFARLKPADPPRNGIVLPEDVHA